MFEAEADDGAGGPVPEARGVSQPWVSPERHSLAQTGVGGRHVPLSAGYRALPRAGDGPSVGQAEGQDTVGELLLALALQIALKMAVRWARVIAL